MFVVRILLNMLIIYELGYNKYYYLYIFLNNILLNYKHPIGTFRDTSA
jgi:hypothetical protein